MKFCANLTLLFTELPLSARIAAAQAAGFDGVEILFPYDENAADLAMALERAQMPLALINSPPPNYTGGPRGFAALPGGQDRFARDLQRVLRYARVLRPQHIHIMAGAAEGPQAHAAFVENLRHATATAPDQSFTIEPLNPIDMPGYFLADFEQALEILAEVNKPNLRLQFDTYHAQIITGDALACWANCAPHVGHVQIGDAPGRGAPGSGTIDFDGFFDCLRQDGYEGWVSAEYTPTGPTGASLDWLHAQSPLPKRGGSD